MVKLSRHQRARLISTLFQKKGQYLDVRVVETDVPAYRSIGGIGVRKGETELLGKINAGLMKMKNDGSLLVIAPKWSLLVPQD